MPISLSSIYAHIAYGIVQKLDLSDFVTFSQVSRKAFKISKTVKTKYVIDMKKEIQYFYSVKPPLSMLIYINYANEGLNIDIQRKTLIKQNYKTFLKQIFNNFPVRLNDCEVHVKDGFCKDLCNSFTEFLSRSYSSVNQICLWDITCSAEAINRLVEIGRVKEIIFYNPLPTLSLMRIMKIGALNNAADHIFTKFMEEADILALRTSKVSICSSNLTTAGAHLILAELLTGNRYIERCAIKTNQSLKKDVILAGIAPLHEEGDVVVKGKNCIFQVTIKKRSILIVNC